MRNGPEPVIGILLDDGFDDWLNSLGMSLESFSKEMMGSWVFNYVQALQRVGVKPIVFCVSTLVGVPTRMIHSPTGVLIILFPPTTIYKAVRPFFEWHTSRRKDAHPEPPNGLIKRLYKVIGILARWYLSTPFIKLFRAVQLEGCRSILVQEYESARFDFCVLIGKLKHIPVFGTFTGGTQTHWLSRPFRRLALHLCAGLAIGAKSEAERIKQEYRFRSDKLALIYSPVDLDVYFQSPKDLCRTSLGIPSNVKLVIYHGQIEINYKGLDVLLRAWRLFYEAISDESVQLLIIGTGRGAGELGRLLSIKNLHGVKWLNQWVHDRGLIRQYLSAADVYVLPSRGDACPNAVIEAMACGLPVLATGINGIADILEGGERSGGILVPVGDANALALSLGRVLEDRLLTCELGQRARLRAENAFSMEIVGKRLSAFLLNPQPY